MRVRLLVKKRKRAKEKGKAAAWLLNKRDQAIKKEGPKKREKVNTSFS